MGTGWLPAHSSWSAPSGERPVGDHKITEPSRLEFIGFVFIPSRSHQREGIFILRHAKLRKSLTSTMLEDDYRKTDLPPLVSGSTRGGLLLKKRKGDQHERDAASRADW